METKKPNLLVDVCLCRHSYGSHVGLKRWPEGTPIPKIGECNSCKCKKFNLKIGPGIKSTSKKMCPECGGEEIFETRSGIGANVGNGQYNPFIEHFWECIKCYSWFFIKNKIPLFN